ncbi:MAG: Sec-independent protein translocase protein TatB [Cocleimonas sp.]
MFDSGFIELLLIGVIALMVVGPERLPGLASKAGKMVGKMKAFVANTREDVEKEIRAEEMQSMLSKQKEEISELRDMMQTSGDEIKSEVNDASNMLGDSINEAEASVSDRSTNKTI